MKSSIAMETPITCIVTIHGIGFQQPPQEGVAGYADDLHTHLSRVLNQNGKQMLSDDPDRQWYQNGDSVPIYVQSVWPPTSLNREDGLKRLGSWDKNHKKVKGLGAPLVKGEARIAHIALVYSGLEGDGTEIEASVITGAMAAVSARHYSHINSLLDLLFLDTIQPLMQSFWEHPVHHDHVLRPSLRIRQDAGYQQRQGPPQHPSGFVALLRELENDVAAYVCHNLRRQRVRSFILDALSRLAFREDVAGIVLNTHSNGTVIGLDVVQELPPVAAKKIRAILTAGSPLRKYVDLFHWGKYITTVPKIEYWWNFWDAKDIVADPLRPSAAWKRGDEPKEDQMVGIYQALDPNGNITPMLINDIEVNNIANGPVGGLQPHNYWDNEKEFIPKVIELLRDLGILDEGMYNQVSSHHPSGPESQIPLERV